MNKFISFISRFWLTLICGLFLLISQPARAQIASARETAEMSQPAVVTVISKSKSGTAFATGFFIESNLVMTNRKLIENDAKVTLMTAGGTRIRMDEVIGVSAVYDIAVIRVSRAGRARLMISDRGIARGQSVTLVGAPLRGVTPYSAGRILDLQESGTLMTLSALVTQRNSGAPILDENGYVIGVATRNAAGKEGNFAVPVDHLQDLIAEATRVGLHKNQQKAQLSAVDQAGKSADANAAAPSDFVEVAKKGTSTLAEDEKKAKAACKYSETQGEYLCDAAVLTQFYSHISIEEQAPARQVTETLKAELNINKAGCVSSVKVIYGDQTAASSVKWRSAMFVIDGEAIAANLDENKVPPADFEVPAGAHFSLTLSAKSHACLLPDVPAATREDLVLLLPVQAGTHNRTVRFVWRQTPKIEALSVWHAMRYQEAPPEAGPPGEQPMPPSDEGAPYGFYGIGVGAGIPLGLGILFGVGGSVVLLGNASGEALPGYLATVGGVTAVAAIVGGAGGALMGVFASRQAQEEHAILWRDYHRAHALWSARAAAYRKWRAYKRSTRSLHDGAH